MYLAKRQKFDWPFALGLGDAAMLGLSLLLTRLYFQYFPTEAGSSFFLLHGFGKILTYGVLVAFFMRRSSLYSWTTFTSRLFRPRRLFITLAAAALGFIVLAAVFGESRGVVKVVALWAAVQTGIAFAAFWTMRLFLRFLMMDRLGLIPHEAIAFVGWTPSMQRVLRGYRRDVGRFQSVVGHLAGGGREEPCDFPLLGDIDDLEKVGEQHGVTLLIVDENALSPERLRDVVLACSRAAIHFRMIPSAFDVLARRLNTRIVSGIPLLGVQGVPSTSFLNRILKRLVDIAGALVGLVLSAPVIAVLAVLVKIESPGPLFYRQVRMGKGGRLFEIIKIRSMRLDAEAQTGAKWAVENDPRRLRIGAFMRKWNLDETPQFWNVLRGDMSLVGPRPERPEFVEVFNHDVNHYNLRHHCRPGLTSWAAIHGLRGNTSITDRLDYDLYYYEHWSLSLDSRIMLRTLLPPKNAY